MKKYIITALLMVCWPGAKGQDPQFSQFYSNYLYLAPSFSGLTEMNRMAFNYRNQWPEIKKGYQTFSASFDKYLEKFHSGVGVLLLQDVAGTGNLRTTNIGIQYSFDFKATPALHLRPGLHFNYTQRKIDFDRLLWNDQISATGNASTTAEPVAMEKSADIDFSFSVMGYTDRFWFGTGVDHLLRPTQSFYFYDDETGNPARVPVKYSFFGGVKFIKNEHLLRPIPTSIQIAFLYRQQDKFRQLDAGVYWYRSPLVLGCWYRGIPFYKEVFNRDAFTLLAGFKAGHVSIGYSYDFSISKLITSTGGSHEVSVSYTFRTKPIQHKPRAVPCPEF